MKNGKEFFDKVVKFYKLRKNQEKFIPGKTRINYVGRIYNEKGMISLAEGFGSAVNEAISNMGLNVSLKRFGIPDVYCPKVGSRDYLLKFYGLDHNSILNEILKMGVKNE